MRKFKYNYKKLKENQTTQYSDTDFVIGEPVEAIYIKSPVITDNGNPFIEALPKPRMDKEVTKDYELKLDIAKGSKDEFTALSEISMLKSLRFKLPFHQKMELEMYNCLVGSYRSRELILGDNNNSKIIGNVYDGTTDGFNLLGASGSGKSSALKILLSRYPQVINHHLEGVGDFKQIVYIIVSTSPNDNFNALYISIAKAVDNALGFVEPVYESRLKKKSTLGEKSLIIEDIIEKFNIGVILIDEIQLMSFSSNKENSFTSLAKLSNDTKVSIAVIGLPEAMNSMFKQEWTARRLGTTIQADMYCENYEYFEMNLTKLLRYNWLKYPIKTTEEGVAILFELTKGAIAYLISFYMRIQLNNLNKNEEIVLTKKYVDETMNKYFYGLTKILTKKEGKTCKSIQKIDLERLQVINEINDNFNAEINKKIQESEMQKQIIEEELNTQDNEEIEIIQYIVKTIQIFDSTKKEKEIIKRLKPILQTYKKKKLELNKEDILMLTVEKLKHHSRRKK